MSGRRTFKKNCKVGKYKFRKGDFVCFPYISRDYWLPENVENMKFDWTHFTEENKEKMDKGDHIPFSAGPRACIGQYFGLMVSKLMLYTILEKFDISSDDKTKINYVVNFLYGAEKVSINLRPRK